MIIAGRTARCSRTGGSSDAARSSPAGSPWRPARAGRAPIGRDQQLGNLDGNSWRHLAQLVADTQKLSPLGLREVLADPATKQSSCPSTTIGIG